MTLHRMSATDQLESVTDGTQIRRHHAQSQVQGFFGIAETGGIQLT